MSMEEGRLDKSGMMERKLVAGKSELEKKLMTKLRSKSQLQIYSTNWYRRLFLHDVCVYSPGTSDYEHFSIALEKMYTNCHISALNMIISTVRATNLKSYF